MHRQQITSRQNPRIKEAVKLRDSRQRIKQRRFIIDGVREIGRALDEGIEFLEVFISPPLCGSENSQELLPMLDACGAIVSEVSPEVFEKLAFGERTDGVVVVARTPERSIEQLCLPSNPVIAVLEGLEKPGNVGAVLRSADGAGLDAVIVADPQTDLFNPNTIRGSVGTVFVKNVCTASTTETLRKLREWRLPIVATRPEGDRLYTDVDFHLGAAIVLGAETTGLSDTWTGSDITNVRLPMRGIADSLNVSTTAAVLFYEALRQRSRSPED